MMWNFDRFGDRIAVLDDQGQSLTYAGLAREGEELRAAVGGRCLCFHLCQNTLGSFLGYVSFVEGGVVPLMLKADLDGELFRGLYDLYHPAFLWAPASFEMADCAPVYERFGYRLLKTPFGTETALHPELRLLLTTSGSTGSPKLVRQSEENIRSNMESIAQYLRLTEDERPITTLPMNYTYGISILNSHLHVGATLLLTDQGLAQRGFWNFLKEQKATSFGGVPYMYEMLNRMRFTRMDLPSLKTMTQAGGRLQPELHQIFAQWCQDMGKQFIVMYGQCEATARMAYLPWEKSLEKIGSMGIPIPGGRFELVDEDGGVITAPDTPGELRYYGPNVTLGYAMKPEDLLRGDDRGGALDTGDMARRDAEGFYYITGRKKRFVKLFGNRVNLDEAERLLKERFPDVDCACAGADDRLMIFSTREEALPQMRAYLSEKLSYHPSAFHTCFLNEIPRNESGKTLYQELA